MSVYCTSRVAKSVHTAEHCQSAGLLNNVTDIRKVWRFESNDRNFYQFLHMNTCLIISGVRLDSESKCLIKHSQRVVNVYLRFCWAPNISYRCQNSKHHIQYLPCHCIGIKSIFFNCFFFLMIRIYFNVDSKICMIIAIYLQYNKRITETPLCSKSLSIP